MKRYIIALRCGGLMEDPKTHYEYHQFIRAESIAAAVALYDKLNDNEDAYFKSECIAVLSDDGLVISCEVDKE